MYFTDKDAYMLDGSVNIMRQLYERVRDVKVFDANKNLSQFDTAIQEKYKRKDSKDTRFFDIKAEDIISVGDDSFDGGTRGHLDLCLSIYPKQGVIITEECGKVPNNFYIEHDTPVYISDPIDGSSYFEDIIGRLSDNPSDRVGEIFDREIDEVGIKRARRQAPNSSVTLLKDNQIKYTIVMNLLTGDTYIGSPEGTFMGDIRDAKTREDISEPLEFFEDENLTMICYTREKGKYERNREGTHLRFFPLHQNAKADIGPIGPLRFANIIDYGDNYNTNIGVIAHNGEKIQESIPNIAIAFFSNGKTPRGENALNAYKLFCDPEYVEQQSGKGMTPNLRNSLYSNTRLCNSGIDNTFLNNYEYPSQFRDTTAIISPRNEPALTMFIGMTNRQYAVRIV